VRITRLEGIAWPSIETSEGGFGRGTDEFNTNHGPQLFVIVEGTATVGPGRDPVGPRDAISVDTGECLELRATSGYVRYWRLEFPSGDGP